MAHVWNYLMNVVCVENLDNWMWRILNKFLALKMNLWQNEEFPYVNFLFLRRKILKAVETLTFQIRNDLRKFPSASMFMRCEIRSSCVWLYNFINIRSENFFPINLLPHRKSTAYKFPHHLKNLGSIISRGLRLPYIA